MLTGTYARSVDAKNRVTIPSRFREEMGEKAVILKGTEKCLVVCSVKTFSMLGDLIEGLPLGHSKAIKRFFFANAKEEKIDGQGRMPISDDLRQSAGITTGKKVVLLGQNSYFEIWDENVWQEYRDKQLEMEVKTALEKVELGEFPQELLLRKEKEDKDEKERREGK